MDIENETTTMNATTPLFSSLQNILLATSLVVILGSPVPACAQDEKSIAGRIDLETHEEYFKVRLFLTNQTDHDITIETGRGGVQRERFPYFSCASAVIQAQNWKGHPRRSMRPMPLTLKPGLEILYDTYIIPPYWHPPDPDKETFLGGYIHFPELDNQDSKKSTGTTYVVRLGSQKLPPPPTNPAGTAKE